MEADERRAEEGWDGSLQVDTPQVSGGGDGVALRTQFLVALWRREHNGEDLLTNHTFFLPNLGWWKHLKTLFHPGKVQRSCRPERRSGAF